MRRFAAATAVLALSASLPVCLPASSLAADSPAPPPAPSPEASLPETAVIDATRLTSFLPQPPAGWAADKPEGVTSDSTGFPLTTVSRVYVKGDADDAPTASIHLIDSANNGQFQEATKAMWSVTSDTPHGYDKKVTVEGLPGFEHYANADQTGVLWVVIGSRFFVQVETTRQPAGELENWLKRIDLKALAALK